MLYGRDAKGCGCCYMCLDDSDEEPRATKHGATLSVPENCYLDLIHSSVVIMFIWIYMIGLCVNYFMMTSSKLSSGALPSFFQHILSALLLGRPKESSPPNTHMHMAHWPVQTHMVFLTGDRLLFTFVPPQDCLSFVCFSFLGKTAPCSSKSSP